MLSNTCFGLPQAVDADRPAAVVGEVDHDLVDLVPADADVERAADVDLEFRVAAQHGQGGHGNHRALLDGQAVPAPNIAEQIFYRDVQKIFVHAARSGFHAEEFFHFCRTLLITFGLCHIRLLLCCEIRNTLAWQGSVV